MKFKKAVALRSFKKKKAVQHAAVHGCCVVFDDVCSDVNSDVVEGFHDRIWCGMYRTFFLLTSSQQSLDLAQLVEHTTVTVSAHIVWSLVRFRQSRRHFFPGVAFFWRGIFFPREFAVYYTNLMNNQRLDSSHMLTWHSEPNDLGVGLNSPLHNFTCEKHGFWIYGFRKNENYHIIYSRK